MANHFVGRRRELEVLESAYRAGTSGFIPIYGRRRVGKSELILRFLDGKPGLYHVGKQAPEGLQLREWLAEAARVLDEPLLATMGAEGWKAALLAVTQRWRRPEPLIIAFDEFQWTAGASPALPSVLQELWDRHWQRSANILLILCGSYVGFMERAVLGRESPLFGRRTGQILLRPFGFQEAAEFHPRYSRVDQARTYFVCGGIPHYLRCFAADRSVEANLTGNLCDEFSPLFREPEFLLREELREVEQYTAVLLAIAGGSTVHKEISERAGIGERSLHYYLQQLLELGYVVRRYPLTGGAVTARQVRYAIGDPLLRFWFRFIFPRLSQVIRRGPQAAFQQCVAPDLDSYFGLCFESLSREALAVLYEREGVTAAFEIGEYWDKTTQIDVVGLRQDRWTDLGECKWGENATPGPIVEELLQRVPCYPNPRNATIAPRVFTRRAVTEPQRAKYPDVRFHSLEDLYGDPPRQRRR